MIDYFLERFAGQLRIARPPLSGETHAARLLGLTRPTLQAKMQKYGIRRETSIRESWRQST